VRAAALVGLAAVLLAACSTNPTPTAAISQGPASGGRTGPVISPPPVTPPTPPGDNAIAFVCKGDVTGGAAGNAHVTDVRVTEEDGFDRLVLQFDGPVPAYSVKRQASPVFTQGGSGQTITLSGTTGVLVRLHTAFMADSYTGQPTDFTQASFSVLKEARLTENFEGYVGWGVGLGTSPCIRAFVPTTPPARLIVDFALTSS
jgi:hypothetical protein